MSRYPCYSSMTLSHCIKRVRAFLAQHLLCNRGSADVWMTSVQCEFSRCPFFWKFNGVWVQNRTLIPFHIRACIFIRTSHTLEDSVIGLLALCVLQANVKHGSTDPLSLFPENVLFSHIHKYFWLLYFPHGISSSKVLGLVRIVVFEDLSLKMFYFQPNTQISVNLHLIPLAPAGFHVLSQGYLLCVRLPQASSWRARTLCWVFLYP